MLCSRFRIGVGIAFFLISLSIGGQTRGADDDAARIAIVSRWEQLQNWTARFDTTLQTDFDPEIIENLPPDAKTAVMKYGLNRTESEHVIYRFLAGRIQVETSLDPEEILRRKSHGLDSRSSTITAVLPDRTERLSKLKVWQGGIISSRADMPDEWTFDIGLGVRLLRESQCLQTEDFKQAKQTDANPDGINLQVQDDKKELHDLHFEKHFGYGLALSRSVDAKGASDEVACSDFRLIGAVYIPFTMVRQSTTTNEKGQIHHPFTRTIHVSEFILDDPKNKADNLLITWPAKASVFDNRNNVRIPVGSSPRALTDDAISQEIRTQKLGGNSLSKKIDGLIGDQERKPSDILQSTTAESVPTTQP